MDSQILNLITHYNVICLQNWVLQIHKSKTCHFWKIMQITPYSIFSNYKLSMVALITFFRCNPIVWKPHQCAHDVLNNSLCLWVWVIHVMDRFPKWHFGWIVHKIFCIPIITPYDICQLAHQICFRPQSCGMLLDHLSRGICNSWFIVNKKQLWGNPPTHFFLHSWHLSPLQSHTMMASPLAST